MRTIIETDSDSELSIQTCKVTVTNDRGTHQAREQICIMIEETEFFADDSQAIKTSLSFLTKHQAMKFAQRILEKAKEL